MAKFEGDADGVSEVPHLNIWHPLSDLKQLKACTSFKELDVLLRGLFGDEIASTVQESVEGRTAISHLSEGDDSVPSYRNIPEIIELHGTPNGRNKFNLREKCQDMTESSVQVSRGPLGVDFITDDDSFARTILYEILQVGKRHPVAPREAISEIQKAFGENNLQFDFTGENNRGEIVGGITQFDKTDSVSPEGSNSLAARSYYILFKDAEGIYSVERFSSQEIAQAGYNVERDLKILNNNAFRDNRRSITRWLKGIWGN